LALANRPSAFPVTIDASSMLTSHPTPCYAAFTQGGVQSSTDVYFTVFSHVDGDDRAAQDAAFHDLGERLAAGLRSQVPPRQ